MSATLVHDDPLAEFMTDDGYDFSSVDSDDLGRWYMENWEDALRSEDDEQAWKSFLLVRQMGRELDRRLALAKGQS